MKAYIRSKPWQNYYLWDAPWIPDNLEWTCSRKMAWKTARWTVSVLRDERWNSTNTDNLDAPASELVIREGEDISWSNCIYREVTVEVDDRWFTLGDNGERVPSTGEIYHLLISTSLFASQNGSGLWKETVSGPDELLIRLSRYLVDTKDVSWTWELLLAEVTTNSDNARIPSCWNSYLDAWSCDWIRRPRHDFTRISWIWWWIWT
jgi:hypothetical protein